MHSHCDSRPTSDARCFLQQISFQSLFFHRKDLPFLLLSPAERLGHRLLIDICSSHQSSIAETNRYISAHHTHKRPHLCARVYITVDDRAHPWQQLPPQRPARHQLSRSKTLHAWPLFAVGSRASSYSLQLFSCSLASCLAPETEGSRQPQVLATARRALIRSQTTLARARVTGNETKVTDSTPGCSAVWCRA